MTRLEAVTCCFGYADFLGETAKFNRHLFDRWVIVTSPSDGETRETCRRFSLPVLLTEEHTRGGPFNKGRCLARALDQIAGDGWIVQLDCDVILPPDLRLWLERAHLDESCIYGVDRAMVRSWTDWCRLRDSGYMQHDYHCRCNFPPGFDVGTRWVSPIHSWVPIGFTQIWHGSADTIHGYHQKPYPSHHGDAARSDVQFALQYDRRKRVLLPDVIAIHLESEPAEIGANWKGRTTRRFGPEPAAPPKPAAATPRTTASGGGCATCPS